MKGFICTSRVRQPAFPNLPLRPSRPLFNQTYQLNETVFRDATHFVAGIPPGDGMHIVWTTLPGSNRDGARSPCPCSAGI
jgi:hypothetical protein